MVCLKRDVSSVRVIDTKEVQGKVLRRSFFMKPTATAAREMLGKYIVHIDNGLRLSGKIVETEAYIGPRDKAAHSYNWKRTPRNRVEYLIGGHIYIYLVYGMYWQLNLTTREEGVPQCVLVRAVEPVDGIDIMINRRKKEKVVDLTNGPGKLCEAFGFNGSLYGLDITRPGLVHLEDRGERVKTSNIIRTKRIGIDYAGQWANKLWRFYIKSSPFVSKK